jgi:hypothetical protein
VTKLAVSQQQAAQCKLSDVLLLLLVLLLPT